MACKVWCIQRFGHAMCVDTDSRFRHSPNSTAFVEAIESYFTRLDDAAATLERVERNLKRYRASVLKAAVEGRLVPTEAALARAEGRSYEPASLLLERRGDSPAPRPDSNVSIESELPGSAGGMVLEDNISDRKKNERVYLRGAIRNDL